MEGIRGLLIIGGSLKPTIASVKGGGSWFLRALLEFISGRLRSFWRVVCFSFFFTFEGRIRGFSGWGVGGFCLLATCFSKAVVSACSMAPEALVVVSSPLEGGVVSLYLAHRAGIVGGLAWFLMLVSASFGG